MIIDLDGILIEVIRKPIKNMYLRVRSPGGDVNVTAPLQLPVDVIRNHLTSKQQWIHTARLRVIARVIAPVVPMEPHEKRRLKQEMQMVLPDLIKHWELIIGVRVSSWGIRAMKTRWGSCNVNTRRISINLHLIHKPRACLEYVVVHELVHLLEANHSKRFYALMTRFLPEWKACKKQLEISRPSLAPGEIDQGVDKAWASIHAGDQGECLSAEC